MIKLIFGFLSGMVFGILYSIEEPHGVIVSLGQLIKSIIFN